MNMHDDAPPGRWPAEAFLDLWHFALDHAIYLWNHMPKLKSPLAPIKNFGSTHFANCHHLQCVHIWGCPVYVLDPMLQDGKKIPK
jgi:hypothetical protein